MAGQGEELSASAPQSRTVARGISIRSYRGGIESFEIQFHFRGVRCRETLKGLPVTRANERYAINLKAEIEGAIGRGTFKYTDYFPDSKRARLLGHGNSSKTI